MEGCLKKLVLEAEAMGFWGLGKSGWKPLAVSRRKYWAGSAQLKANGFILTSRRAKKLIPVYSDRASHFFLTRKAGEPVDRQRLTQAGRALRELGIQMIPAYSPQARGRSERNFGTWQGRLPQELRLRGIITLEAANRFLREGYIGEFNRRFAVPATQPGSAFLPSARRELERIFSIQHQRIVNRDNTVSLENRLLQIEKTPWRGTLAGCRVTVYEHLDGTLSIGYGPHTVGRYSSEGVAIRCGGRRRSPVASRQHHLALTSVALRAPSVSAKSLSVES